MNKATVNMTNWELCVYEENYNLSGTADNHPTLGKNAYVARISSLVDYSFADDVLIYETRNTIYVCPLKYMILWPYRNVAIKYCEELTHRADASDCVLDKIIAATAKLSIQELQKNYQDPEEKLRRLFEGTYEIKGDYSNDDELLKHIKELQVQGQSEIEEMEQREKKRLIDIACQYEDCVYIEVSNVECGNLLAYHLGNDKGVVYPSLRIGMFQNSVWYMKYDSEEDDLCILDFRYFPRGWEDDVMETYCWSDNIVRAVIKNETDHVLSFNQIDIPIGETMIFESDEQRQGLFSLNCHK